MRVPVIKASVKGDTVQLDFDADVRSVQLSRAGWKRLCDQVRRLMNLQDLSPIRETFPLDDDTTITTV